MTRALDVTTDDSAATSTGASEVANIANSDANSYHNVSSASASYSNATHENITLASYYATSYSDDASTEASSADVAKSELNAFYLDHANNSAFGVAQNKANKEASDEPNASALAHGYGVNVFHHSPTFVTVQRGSWMHTQADFNQGKHIATVPAGAHLQVAGVGFDVAGHTRYIVNYKGNRGYITSNEDYVKDTYLIPGETYKVTFANDAAKHTGLSFGQNHDKVTGKVNAGETVTGTAVAADNYFLGVARLQLSDGTYVTTRDTYLKGVTDITNGGSNYDNALVRYYNSHAL